MKAVYQGDIYWVRRGLDAMETQFPHPYVVIQEDYLNHSRLSTVVACALRADA